MKDQKTELPGLPFDFLPVHKNSSAGFVCNCVLIVLMVALHQLSKIWNFENWFGF